MELSGLPTRGIKLSYMFDVFTNKGNFPVELRSSFKCITMAQFLKDYYYPFIMKSKPDPPKNLFYSDYLEQDYEKRKYVGSRDTKILYLTLRKRIYAA